MCYHLWKQFFYDTAIGRLIMVKEVIAAGLDCMLGEDTPLDYEPEYLRPNDLPPAYLPD